MKVQTIMNAPHLIALSGRPGSGKTEVQKILESLGVKSIDDGHPMRQFAVNWLGMSWDDVLTAEGKKGYIEVLGRKWQVREILGELGNRYEAMFGKHIMPYMATRNLNKKVSYCFGSVRRDQGGFYQELGGVTIGVRRPGVAASKFEFDQFDESLIDIWIENDGSLEKLQLSTFAALTRLQSITRPVVSSSLTIWPSLRQAAP